MRASEAPAFDDETGEALNEAALALVRDALAAEKREDVEATGGTRRAPLGPVLSSIPVVECAEGTWKYVQVQLTHPSEPEAQVLVVRSYDSCGYHAENYRELMRRLQRDAKTSGVVGRVIGGGRIRFHAESPEPSAAVYGYSKTFGRTPGCNERTAEIIKRECEVFQGRVTWSDDGY
jgi:phosphohistidine phosphatase